MPKRYYREDDGAIYDREEHRYIEPTSEQDQGDHYIVDHPVLGREAIYKEDIEEKR
jgi:hypothetical protein